jgi:hypothetical protein
MKIQVIDSKRDFSQWAELLNKGDISLNKVRNFFDVMDSLEQALSVSAPDVVLCHANDLLMGTIYEGRYIANCTQKNIHVLLFSGGGVEFSVLGPDKISLQTNETKGPKEITGCKSDFIHACSRTINDESDLPIEAAVTAVIEAAGTSAESRAEVLINTLVGYDPVLESSLGLLYATLSSDLLNKFVNVNSIEYDLLLGRIPAERARLVRDNVAILLTDENGERDVLIREVRDALLPSN